MFQKMIASLYSLWPILVIFGVISGVLSFFFSKESIDKVFSKPPYNVMAVIIVLLMFLSGITQICCSKVPKTIGYSYDVALSSLRSADLDGVLAPGNTFDANKRIDAQSIAEGTVVKKNKMVELSYKDPVIVGESADGKVPVPNVVGMEQMEATSLLTESGLQFQVWWTDNGDFEYSEIYYIIDQSIPADSEVPAGALIRLELSAVKP